jgi:hypothetical protein
MIHSEQRIREIAYFIWEKEGCPEDRAELHWTAAEAIVDGEDVEEPKKVVEESPRDLSAAGSRVEAARPPRRSGAAVERSASG